MSEIYYALIIFPLLFMIAMGYIYASSLAEIQVELVKLNCPYPYNSAIAYAKLADTGSQVIVYNVTLDSSSSNYHITTFRCYDANINSTGGRIGSPSPAISNTVYTTANNWFNVASVAGGYMFYIAQSMTEFFLKVISVGTLIQLFINAPALVLDIPQYTYVNIILITFIGLGGFMVIRG